MCVSELVASLGQQAKYAEVAGWATTAEQTTAREGAASARLTCLIRTAGYLLPGGQYQATDAVLARVEAASAGFTNLDPGQAAKVKAAQATRCLHSGDQAGAIGLLEAAVELAAATGDARAMCEMRVNLASVWADMGQLEPAETLLRQTLQEAQSIELHYIATAVLINLAPVLTHGGRLGEARRLTMQALNFARKQG